VRLASTLHPGYHFLQPSGIIFTPLPFFHCHSGISEEKTLNPVQLATMKADRIAREKAAAAQNAVVRIYAMT